MIAFVMMGVLAVLGFLCVSEVVPTLAQGQKARTALKAPKTEPIVFNPAPKARAASKFDIVVPPSYRPLPAARPHS